MSAGFGCVRRMPWALVITTNSAPVCPQDLGRQHLQLAARAAVGGLRGDVLLAGQRLRDRQRSVLELVVELPVHVPLHYDRSRLTIGEHQDRHHHDDDLGGQALPHVAPEG